MSTKTIAAHVLLLALVLSLNPSQSPARRGHAEARAIIDAAVWAELGRAAEPAELQAIQALAHLETRYGTALGGNNWGGIHCPRKSSPAFDGTDTRPDGTKYKTRYCRYRSPERGARGLVRVLYRRPEVVEAMRASSLPWFAAALYRSGYYEGTGRTPAARVRRYQRGLANRVARLARALGEPVWLR